MIGIFYGPSPLLVSLEIFAREVVFRAEFYVFALHQYPRRHIDEEREFDPARVHSRPISLCKQKEETLLIRHAKRYGEEK